MQPPQPQRGQQQPQPFPPPYPQSYYGPPPPRGWSTGKIVGVIVALVVVLLALAIIVPPLLNAANRAANPPNIQLTNTNAAWTGGCLFGDYPPHQATYTFTLVNSGGTGGYATVGFIVDDGTLTTNRYYVNAGQSQDETQTVSINDCVDHTWNIEIQSVTT